MKSLKSIQQQVEELQDEYMKRSALNAGVIRGASDTSEIGERIEALMRDYNARAKRTMYYGGKIVPRRPSAA